MADDPVLDALLDAVRDATSAAHGWILAVEGDELVVAAARGDGTDELERSRYPLGAGTAGWVLASSQPAALQPRRNDALVEEGVAGHLGLTVEGIVSVPCPSSDGSSGVIELVNKTNGRFNFDDIELVTLFARVAGIVLDTRYPDLAVPSPDQLGQRLTRLRDIDSARYAHVARAVDTLIN